MLGGLLQAKTKRPNIVLVLFDDLGWKDFTCYGNSNHSTPNIDALAKEGVKFNQAYAACPVCSPSRAALLTGNYPPRSGVTDWIPGRAQWPTAKLVTPRTQNQLALEEQTIAERLKPLGYRTASIGKWHLGGANGFLPTNQGFDQNIGGNHKGANGYFGPFDLPGLDGRNKDHYLTTELGTAARSFMASSKDPFFLYWPNYAVHLPLQAPGVTGDAQIYAEMLRLADQEIGNMRQELKSRGDYEDTIWILTSDNGGLLHEGKSPRAITDNRPLRAGKGHLYEGGIRVPLIIKAPGISKPGLEVDDRVCGIDIVPTVMDLLGQKPDSKLDGVSLQQSLKGKKARRGAPLYWHYPHYSNQGGVPGGAIIEDDWKLIEFYEDRRLELFHLKQDPSESLNLAAQQKAMAIKLRDKLETWRKGVGAVIPTSNPGYDASKADQGLFGQEKPTAEIR
jgi:arylsulfatase A